MNRVIDRAMDRMMELATDWRIGRAMDSAMDRRIDWAERWTS